MTGRRRFGCASTCRPAEPKCPWVSDPPSVDREAGAWEHRTGERGSASEDPVAADRRRRSMASDRRDAWLRRTPVALALIALNVAVYLALTAAPGLEQVLGLSAGWEGVADRPWTPVSVLFTAGNLLHLAGAVGFIIVFGRDLEELAGGRHLLMVYLLTGFAGSLALTALAEPTGLSELSLGASASFLGLFGAIAVLPHSERIERFPVGPILAAIVLANIASPLMDIGGWASSAAHGAGIAVGAIYGRALRSRVRTRALQLHHHADPREPVTGPGRP